MGGAHPNILGHPLALRFVAASGHLIQRLNQRMALGGRTDFSCRPEAVSGKWGLAAPGK
jgi:hypothetical protein